MKVVGTDGAPIADAVVRVDRNDWERARTDDTGCTAYSRVTGGGDFSMLVEKSNYKPARFLVRNLEPACVVARLQPESASSESEVERVAEESCPCASNSGRPGH